MVRREAEALAASTRLTDAVRSLDMEAAEIALGDLQVLAQEAGDAQPILRLRLLRGLRAYCSASGDIEGVVEACSRMLESPLCGQAESEFCFMEIFRWGDQRDAREALERFMARADVPAEQRAALLGRVAANSDLRVAEKLLPQLKAAELDRRKLKRMKTKLVELRETRREARDEDGYRISDEVTVARNPNPTADATVLVFNGLQRPEWFSFATMRACFHPLGAHMIYLRDAHNLLFSHGISQLGPDLKTTLAKLREQIDALGSSRLLCIGNSAGGYGAILYGCELNAASAMAFATPTTIAENAEEFDHREPLVHGVLRSRVPPSKRPALDLLPRLESRQPPLRVALHFGERHREDSMHARRVGHVPGVSLHPVPGLTEHGTFPALRRSGQIDALLEAFVRG